MLFTFFQIKVFWKHLAWPNPKECKEFAEEIIYVSVMCTVKAIPLQAWTGPEGSRRLRLPDFMTIGT